MISACFWDVKLFSLFLLCWRGGKVKRRKEQEKGQKGGKYDAGDILRAGKGVGSLFSLNQNEK